MTRISFFRNAAAKCAIQKLFFDRPWSSAAQPVCERTFRFRNSQSSERCPRHARFSTQVCDHFSSHFHSFIKFNDQKLLRMANRNSAKMNDGSLSDTQTYAEVKPEFSTYAMWLKHSSTTASRLSEGDSLESVSVVSSPGLSRNSKLIHSRETTPTAQQQQQAQNSRLNRSNSIRYALKL